jgi:sensor histidine kinase YesM
LTALLRAVLRSDGELTTLGRELDIVECYLDIERARFEQRLRVTIDVSARLRDVRVPALVLQPLVENAIKHGIAHKESGGEVTVRARVEHVDGGERRLSLTVADTGVGPRPRRFAEAEARASASTTCSGVSSANTATRDRSRFVRW